MQNPAAWRRGRRSATCKGGVLHNAPGTRGSVRCGGSRSLALTWCVPLVYLAGSGELGLSTYLLDTLSLPGVPLGVPVPFRCLDSARGMEPSWKVRGCRAARHRLLAGRDRAREAKAGVRTPLAGACGRRALDRADLVPGRRRRRTRQPGPLVMSRRGGTASTRPAGTAPGTRADSPAYGTGATPGMAAWSASTLTIFRLPSLGSGVKAGFGVRGDRRGSRAERHFSHDVFCQQAFYPASPPDRYPADDQAALDCRRTCRPWPGRMPWSAA